MHPHSADLAISCKIQCCNGHSGNNPRVVACGLNYLLQHLRRWFAHFTMLRLICQDGEKVSIATPFLKQLSLFQNRPELAAAGSYHLRCEASHGVVDDLVAKIYDGSARITITHENAGQMRALCSELGFSGLDEELQEFENSRAQVCNDEMLASLEKSVAQCQTELLSMRDEIHRLQELSAENTARLSSMETSARRVSDSEADDKRLVELGQRIESLEKKVGDAVFRSEVKEICQQEICSLRESLLRFMKLLASKLEELGQKSTPSGGKLRSWVFPYVKERPFDGIIAHLTREYGGNVHDKGIVAVTASSVGDPRYPAKNAADLSAYNWFVSGDRANSWLCYEFKDFRVSVGAWSVRSFGYGRGAAHPQALKLQGSDDGVGWTDIGRVYDLNDRYATKAQVLQKETDYFRYVRLTQEGKNCCQSDILALSAFEIFGFLIDCRVNTMTPGPPKWEEERDAVKITTGPDGVKVATCIYEPWGPKDGIFAYLGATYGPKVGNIVLVSCSYNPTFEWNDYCSECRRKRQWDRWYTDKCDSCSKRYSEQQKRFYDQMEARRSIDCSKRSCGCDFPNEPNQWITYDFRQRRVALVGYSLTPLPSGPLILRGSDDGKLWQDLDLRSGGNEVYRVLPRVMREPSRYIRLLRPDKGTFTIQWLEFFGTVYEAKTQ